MSKNKSQLQAMKSGKQGQQRMPTIESYGQGTNVQLQQLLMTNYLLKKALRQNEMQIKKMNQGQLRKSERRVENNVNMLQFRKKGPDDSESDLRQQISVQNQEEISNSEMVQPVGNIGIFPLTRQGSLIYQMNMRLTNRVREIRREWQRDTKFQKENQRQLDKLKGYMMVINVEDFNTKEVELKRQNYEKLMKDEPCHQFCEEYVTHEKYESAVGERGNKRGRGNKNESSGTLGVIRKVLDVTCCLCILARTAGLFRYFGPQKTTVYGEMLKIYEQTRAKLNQQVAQTRMQEKPAQTRPNQQQRQKSKQDIQFRSTMQSGQIGKSQKLVQSKPKEEQSKANEQQGENKSKGQQGQSKQKQKSGQTKDQGQSGQKKLNQESNKSKPTGQSGQSKAKGNSGPKK